MRKIILIIVGCLLVGCSTLEKTSEVLTTTAEVSTKVIVLPFKTVKTVGENGKIILTNSYGYLEDLNAEEDSEENVIFYLKEF